MRHIISLSSVKAIYLNKEELLEELRKACEDALKKFPTIREILLFGSLARGEETGLSDIDLFIVAENLPDNPFERIKPYFDFFADRLKIGIDIIVVNPSEKENFKELLKNSLPLIVRSKEV